MTRLLVLCEYPTLLGGERSFLAAVPTLKAAGFDLLFAVPPRGPLIDFLRENNLDAVGWNLIGSGNKRLALDRIRESLAELIKQYRPDQLHANSLSTARIAGPVADDLNLPSSGHLRDIIKLSRQAIRDLDRHRLLIAVSHACRDFHLQQGLTAGRTVVCYNGVDLQAYSPDSPTGSLRTQLGIAAQTPLVTTIGQLSLRKGTDIVIEIALEVCRRLPRPQFLIVGQRTSGKQEAIELEDRLHSRVHVANMQDRIHFLGSRDDVPDILRETTLLLHAARQEPLGRVLLEAAATATPIVASDVGGTQEIFPPAGKAAHLVPIPAAGQVENSQMLHRMLELLEDEHLRDKLAHAARQRMEAAFDIKPRAKELANLLSQLA